LFAVALQESEVGDVNSQNVSSDELIAAITAGSQSIVAELLRHNPSLVNARDNRGVSMLLRCIYYFQFDILELFLRQRSTFDIFEAATLGRDFVVRELLERNPLLSCAWSGDGLTPLHLACFYGHLKVVQTLVEKGADIFGRTRDDNATTPLHSVAAGGSTEIARLLLDRGAEPDCTENNGWTSLHYGAYNGQIEMVDLLLQLGGSPNIRNLSGQTPSDLALASGRHRISARIEKHAREPLALLPSCNSAEDAIA